MDATLFDLAGKAYDSFESKQRPGSDDKYDTYDVLKDDRPEWVYKIVRSAHGEFLPDDWRYSCIRSAFGWIHDNEPEDDDSSEFADAEVDVYNASLFAWLASNIQRQSYVDEAVSEFGYPEVGGVAQAISLGQYLEAKEVYAAVWRGLEAQISTVVEP